MATSRLADRRRTLAVGALALEAVVVVLVALDLSSPVRIVAGTVFVLAVPGWAIVGLLGVRNPTFEWPLAVATSLALATLVAQGLVWAGWWSPFLALTVLAAVATPALLVQLAHRPSPAAPATGTAAHVG